MSLVLVVARPPSAAPAASNGAAAPAEGGSVPAAEPGARTPDRGPTSDALWRAVREEVGHLRGVPPGGVTPGRLDLLAAAVAEDADDPSVAYAATPEDAIAAVRRAAAAGATTIAVVPIALAVDTSVGSLAAGPDLARLDRLLEGLGRELPGVEIQYVGPPFDDPPALRTAIAALRPAGSEEPELLAGAIDRAFDGDLDRFGRFMAVLQAGMPPGTRLVLRGSAVQGASYQTGEPFDARGPGTSDLDVVLLGDEAMAAWEPEAFYLPGVNTRPLWDDEPSVAPSIEPARVAAQAVAGRPVSLQAMARWFLDLRSGLQGTPYVVLGGG